MRASWHQTLVDRLIGNAHPRGGWAYREGNSVCAEPTAIASLALAAHQTDAAAATAGVAWLATDQRSDGRGPVSPQVEGPCWPTGLAVLAWTHAAAGPRHYRQQIDRAVDWLLATTGRESPATPRFSDTTRPFAAGPGSRGHIHGRNRRLTRFWPFARRRGPIIRGSAKAWSSRWTVVSPGAAGTTETRAFWGRR